MTEKTQKWKMTEAEKGELAHIVEEREGLDLILQRLAVQASMSKKLYDHWWNNFMKDHKIPTTLRQNLVANPGTGIVDILVKEVKA